MLNHSNTGLMSLGDFGGDFSNKLSNLGYASVGHVELVM